VSQYSHGHSTNTSNVSRKCSNTSPIVFYDYLKDAPLKGQLEAVETETRNGKWKQSKLDANEC